MKSIEKYLPGKVYYTVHGEVRMTVQVKAIEQYLHVVMFIIFHRLRSKYMRKQIVGISQLVLQTTF